MRAVRSWGTLAVSVTLLLSACASTRSTVPPTREGPKLTTVEVAPDASGAASGTSSGTAEDESAFTQQVQQGIVLARSRQAQRAIREHFDPVIQHYEARYAASNTRMYCANSTMEAVGYAMLAAKDGVSARVLGPAWAAAYFFKGYSLVELGNPDDARAWVEKAVALSPWNWMFLSELGHIHQTRHDWQAAMRAFNEALQHADLGPADEVPTRKTRALRGLGFSLIELGRLDEAEAKFRAALELDPNDERSKHELQYIEQKRKQGQPNDGSL